MAHVTDMPGMPMYLKIKNDIMQQVKNNLLLPGDRLPTELQLMEKYGVSRITVSKALGELKNEGYVERFPNKGTFVADASLASSLVNDVEVPERTEPTSDILPEFACILPTLKDLFSLTMLNGALWSFRRTVICAIYSTARTRRWRTICFAAAWIRIFPA